MIPRAVNNNPRAPVKSQPPVPPTALGPVDATLRIIHTGRALELASGCASRFVPNALWATLFPQEDGGPFSLLPGRWYA